MIVNCIKSLLNKATLNTTVTKKVISPQITNNTPKNNKKKHKLFFLDNANQHFANSILKPSDFNYSWMILLRLLTNPYYLFWVVIGIISCILSLFFFDSANRYYGDFSNKIVGDNVHVTKLISSIAIFATMILMTYITTHIHTWLINYFFMEKIKNELLVYVLKVNSNSLEGKETVIIKCLSDLPLHITQLATKIAMQLHNVIFVAYILFGPQDNSESESVEFFFYFLALIFLIIATFVGYKFYNHIKDLSDDIAEIHSNITVRTSDIVNNRKIIDLFKQSNNEYSKILEYKYVLENKQAKKISSLCTLSLFLVLITLLLGVIYFGILFFKDYSNKMNYSNHQGNVMPFTLSILKPTLKLIVLAKSISDFVINLLTSLEISLLIEENLKVFQDMYISKELGSELQNNITNSIVMDNLRIFTPDNKLLIEKNISPIILKPGNIYALLGKSGSGKSTLMNILQKLYTNFDGTVHIDNVSLSRINSFQYKDLLSIIPQRYELMQRSLRENITFSHETWHDDEIKRIMKTVDLQSFLDLINNNLDYPIIKGGVNISGGQAQRICITRAIYKIHKGAKILIADEPFSALDQESAKEVLNLFQTIAEESKIIIIIIDHTGLAAKNATKNILIHNKEIYFDSKKELLKQNPEFYNLYYRE